MNPLRFALLLSVVLHLAVLLGLPDPPPRPETVGDAALRLQVALLAAAPPSVGAEAEPKGQSPSGAPAPPGPVPEPEARSRRDAEPIPKGRPPRSAREIAAAQRASAPEPLPDPVVSESDGSAEPSTARLILVDPSPTTGTDADAVSQIDAEQDYKRALQAEIARNKRYPRLARRLGQEGTVEVAFVVLSDGELRDVRIARGSGFTPLDRGAVDTLHRLGRFRPIPPELERERWDLVVPLSYELH